MSEVALLSESTLSQTCRVLTESGERLLIDAGRRAAAYIQAAPERRVAPSAQAVDALRGLIGPLPASPSEPGDVLECLDRIGSPATVARAADGSSAS
jgi:hypothetical protein